MSLPAVVSQDEWLAARQELLAAREGADQGPRRPDQRPAGACRWSRSPSPMRSRARRRCGAARPVRGPPAADRRATSCSTRAGRTDAPAAPRAPTRSPPVFWSTWPSATPRSPTSPAPRYAKLERYKAKRGWTFPWYSSHGSDFNYDFGVTLDPSVKPVAYNFRSAEEFAERGGRSSSCGEFPGRSHFLRVEDRVFHTYSVYARGLESIGGSYYLLDETALGRQEEWEEPKGRSQSARVAQPNFAS